MNKTIIKIESIAAGGEGIGRFEGKAVFVRQTAPGDLVRCRISEDHKTWARAELEEIVEASPDRIQPACPYYGVCGGCDFQHLPYQVQITTKTAILRDAFTRIGKITPPELKIFTSPPWEYRNRMKFHFLDGRIKIGLKANKSNEIIPIIACQIADPGIQAFLKNTNQPETPGSQASNSSHPDINAKIQNNSPQPFTVYSRDNVFLIE
ncbi:MAG: TRAM domain-containing protein, partial [Treponema sp.]|nr:TRAM domain-containing protein [Treponema sp.]